ncbi:extracellular solute-binding protein [Eubacterium sp. 1001713B170207_170306_E7]|uniref:extracellular solute-binding protein n=1 Tax=Eubacterium sp. 1001713B170207_170306_E7 TaxID=2787097 RepID=UPI00189A14EA|nr:extracellular solute-binding protein [Eubacterium sp. 1001713B170207_170306_E7]
MKILKYRVTRGLIAVLMLLFITILSGCDGRTAATAEDENFLGVDLEGRADQEVITITASAGLDHFAAAVEAKFPNIRLVQDSYMGEFRINEHIARVDNQDLGDLVMIIAGLIPKADLTGQLMDLSTQPFPANYNSNALQMDSEGHIYLLPGPLNLNCNIYNKTLFDEKGWSVPKNYEELLELSQTIDQTGIRGYQYVLNDTSIQSYQIYNYCALSALDTLTTVEGQTWHNQLTAGQAVSLDPMKVSFQNLQRLIDAGIVRTEDMEVTNKIRMARMSSRQAAITPGAVTTLNQLNEGGTDEYRFMPHFSMTDGHGWLLNAGYYFGANQELRQPGNEKKLEAAMQILEFVASDEGQQALMADELGMVATTRGATLPDDPAYDGIRTQVESGHYVMRPTYDMFTTVLETEIAAFIRGETTSDAVLEKCQTLLEEGVPEEQAIGQASASFTVLQTGQLKADALRSATGAEIALIGMSEPNCYDPVAGTRSKLYEGAVTADDVTRIAQPQMGKSPLCGRTALTGAQLLELLDYGAASTEEQAAGHTSGFHPYAVSGLTLRYDLDGEAGARATEVKMGDGKALDPETVYTVAFLEGALPEAYLSDSEVSERSMTDAFSDYISKEQTVTPDTGRVRFQ